MSKQKGLKTHNLKDSICFICGKKCLEGTYAHFDCALEAARREDEGKEEVNG